ncbi:MAG: AraC family transcriptional regulator [Clostridia bacterium]|nr:AraC family transcriptional regulator [Clostridia bacterium]
MKNLNIVNECFADLNPRVYGYDHCPPGRAVGPKAVNYTMIHYVESGKGTLQKNGEVWQVLPGHAFIINAGEIATYTADEEDPWFYRYISFDGALSKDFSRLPPVFESSPDFFRAVCDVTKMPCKRESKLASLLFDWHSELCAADIRQTDDYTEAVKQYINDNYMLDLSIKQMAEKLFISQGHLGRVFKKATGQSVQEYIVDIRLKHAKHCFAENMSVTEAAGSCGFSDVSNFSKLFKKRVGISPQQYKKSLNFKYSVEEK